jgi:hypothetical protein
MSRRPASPHGCSVHSAGLGLRTRPLGGRRRLPAIADSPSGIGEPGGARAPRARAPYPRGRSFRANICDFLAPAPPHAIPRLRGLPSTKLLLQQDALHDRPGTAGAAPPGCVSTRRRPLRGGPSTHSCRPQAIDGYDDHGREDIQIFSGAAGFVLAGAGAAQKDRRHARPGCEAGCEGRSTCQRHEGRKGRSAERSACRSHVLKAKTYIKRNARSAE